MSNQPNTPGLSEEQLRSAIMEEYSGVALEPALGRHFHTGWRACEIHGYTEDLYKDLPDDNVASFAGTGNPFSCGEISVGETVVDIGSGAGTDSLIAGKFVGPTGQVVGIDMTQAMLDKAREGAEKMGFTHVEFRQGYMENLPLPDEFADVVISNGVLNLTLNKAQTLREWWRVLKPGGRLQIADIIITRPIPSSAMENINLWTA